MNPGSGADRWQNRLRQSAQEALGAESWMNARAALEQGANPNAQDEEGLSSLGHAIWQGDLGLCDLMMEFGGKVEEVTSSGNALHLAARGRGGEVLARWMMNHCQADPSVGGPGGDGALMEALWMNSPQSLAVAQAYWEKHPFKEADAQEALRLLSKKIKDESVRWLINKGTDPFAVGDEGFDALDCARAGLEQALINRIENSNFGAERGKILISELESLKEAIELRKEIKQGAGERQAPRV